MSAAPVASASDRRVHGFLRRLTFAAAWGEGLDGYDLGAISVVLPLIVTSLHLGAAETGLLGASSLLGIFIGAPLAGRLTDRFGRRTIFTVDIVSFIVLGALQAVVPEWWELFVVRVLLGVAIGAEYSVGPAMLAEFTPAAGRGRRLSLLLVSWYGGYLISVVVSFALVQLGGISWRWVLATSVLPAIVTAVVRIGFPESPRWLLNHGREQEARAVVDERLGGDAYFEREHFGAEEETKGGYRALFSPQNRARTVFIAAFWACNVAPYFAIFTFAPTVLKTLHLANETVGTIVVNLLAAIGAVVGMLTLERVGRRKQVIPPFWVMAAALAVVGFWAGAPGAVVVACFAVFSFFNALQGNLTAVYPIEVFPTEVRSTGVGFAAACSRIAAAAGTFLLPVGIDALGIGPCMVIAAVICVIGAVVCQRMAPETTGADLHASSIAPLRAERTA